MQPPAAPPVGPAPVNALSEAIALVRARLFPFRFERWIALGFVAFLDGCGRGGGSANLQLPGFPGGGGSDSDEGGDFAAAGEWLGEHLVLVVAVALVALALILALTALVLWIHSRGVFMYLDAVATGRWEITRPWREHRERAWSYFMWKLGVALATLLGVLLLLVPMAWLGYTLATAGAACAPILGLVVLGLLLVALIVAASLFSLLLRDFAAPLQWRLDVPCERALLVAWGLVRAHPGAFAGYLGLKIAYSVAAGVLAVLAGCLTCCIGFLPVISHTLLQPLHYFERAWSLMLLRQAGHDLFAGAPPPEPGSPPSLGFPAPAPPG